MLKHFLLVKHQIVRDGLVPRYLLLGVAADEEDQGWKGVDKRQSDKITDQELNQMLGQKEYEINNHASTPLSNHTSASLSNHSAPLSNHSAPLSTGLGNVQATISDLKYPIGKPYGEITSRLLALRAAYDYYPFGMLMPDRYVSDTSTHCVTVLQQKWLWRWVTVSCWDQTNWVWPGYTGIGKGQAKIYDGEIEIAASKDLDGVSFTLPVTAGVDHQLTLELSLLENTGAGTSVQVRAFQNDEWEILASSELRLGMQFLKFMPSLAAQVELVFVGPVRASVVQICLEKWTLVQDQVLVDVCDGDKDRYRFGFNGMLKDNELKGIGNSLDFGARIYDSRVGRFSSLDPLAKKFPSESNYTFAGNNPILFIDRDGEKKTTYNVMINERTNEVSIKVVVSSGLMSINRSNYNGLDYYDWHDYSSINVTYEDMKGRKLTSSSDPFIDDFTKSKTSTVGPFEWYAKLKINDGQTKDKSRARNGKEYKGYLFTSKSGEKWVGRDNKLNPDGHSSSKAVKLDELLGVFGVAGGASSVKSPKDLVSTLKYLVDAGSTASSAQETAPIKIKIVQKIKPLRIRFAILVEGLIMEWI